MTGVAPTPTISNPACFVLLDCAINGSRPPGKEDQPTVLVVKRRRVPTSSADWMTENIRVDYIYVLLVEKGPDQLVSRICERLPSCLCLTKMKAYLKLDQLGHGSNIGQGDSPENSFSAFSSSNMLRITYRHLSSVTAHGEPDLDQRDMHPVLLSRLSVPIYRY